MKSGDISYLTKEGIKNTVANRLMTIASVGVLVACMVVIGLAILISENGDRAIKNLEKENVVMAYMKDYSWAQYGEHDKPLKTGTNGEIDASEYLIHNDEEAQDVCKNIEKIDNVQKVEFISSEDGLKGLTKDMFADQEQYFSSFLNEKHGNPLSCAAKVTMENMEDFDKTLEKIQKIDGIDVIRSQADSAKKIVAIKNAVKIAGAWIVAILMIISLVIVSNTIRITMYNRKLEISIMKAVGATNSFVRLPFIVEGVTIGIISAIISEGLLYVCYRIVSERLVEILGNSIIPYSDVALPLLGIFAGIGIVSGIIGSSIMISKYLRKEGSEFAAI
ncbi:MAG: ABC transporter permease [Clostridia bacterium]|nr:ABC transporter permease [Clostridia bacterium]